MIDQLGIVGEDAKVQGIKLLTCSHTANKQ